MALLHEIGHVVDRALGSDTFASTSGYQKKLLDVIYSSDTLKRFQERRDKDSVPVPFMADFPCPVKSATIRYNATTREVFAHSYAWWIAATCREEMVKLDWKRYQKDALAWVSFPQWQYPETDFDKIALEFERVMRFAQWIL